MNNTRSKNRLSNKICPDGMTIEEWQIALRNEAAREANFKVEHLDDNRIWGDYLVSSSSGRYRTAFRGVCSDRNFCSCLDFRTNGLGTCKHLEAVSIYLQECVPGYPWASMSYSPSYTSVYVSYKGERCIRMRIGSDYMTEYLALYQQYFDQEGILRTEHYDKLERIVQAGTAISSSFRFYPDVYELVSDYRTQEIWQSELEHAYPTKRIPWNKKEYSDYEANLECALYDLCERGNALIVIPRGEQLPHLIARLCEEVYQGIAEPEDGYVILDKPSEVHLWQDIWAQYDELRTIPLHIVTEADFVTRIAESYRSASFVYIHHSDLLKQWQNHTSLALKRVKIAHLYMRTDSLASYTPVQLSSILQHISPFVLGPFYKFIHKYRPIFPLCDDGSNMPLEASHAIALYNSQLLIEVEQAVLRISPHTSSVISPIDNSSFSRVKALLQSLVDVARDPEAMRILTDMIKQLPK